MPPKKSKAAAAKTKQSRKAGPVETPADTNGAESTEDVTQSEETAKAEEQAEPEVAPSNAPAAEETQPERDTETKEQLDETEEVKESAEPEKSEEPEKSDEVDKSEEPAKPEEPEQSEATAEKEEPKQPAAKSKKRKAEETAKEPSKASRRSARSGPKAQPSNEKLLNFLLSNEAADMCRPEDEIKDLEEKGKDLRTYSSTVLSPFEELLCAIVLSRPISHRLGLRTIRTILNPPYGFTSPKAIKGFTPEQRHQAMFDAKTQHKDKTASQIGMVADVIAEKFGKNDEDTSLEKVREKAKKDWDQERTLLQESIKGLGKTGLDIFFRRVQWLWPESFPFVDERTARGIEKLGLPKHPDELLKVLNDNWSKLDKSTLPKGDKETQKRRAYVVICERATGGDLEGKTEAIVDAAATS